MVWHRLVWQESHPKVRSGADAPLPRSGEREPGCGPGLEFCMELRGNGAGSRH